MIDSAGGNVMSKPLLFALVGPTGSGKTATAIEIAKRIDAEIISMDSMQIYRGMDIGTAKPTKSELSAVRHHMIDVADPDELFTVSRYREMTYACIDDVLARGKRVILVGGTGLYLQALSYEMKLGDNGADTEIRNRLNAIAAEEGGAKKLHNMLKLVDPQTAEKLHPNDVRRVVRALEIYETSGKSKSDHTDEVRIEGPYRIKVYGLSLPRDIMYERVNQRVDQMIRDGLVDEVKTLLKKGVEPRREGGAMQAIGYKEIVSALRGDMSMDEAVCLIKQSSRRYAKRQWTWFRRDERTKWYDWTEYSCKEALIEALYASFSEALRCESES